MALVAGGTRTAFVKPNVYTIGDGGEQSLREGGHAIVSAVRGGATVISALICTAVLLAAGVLSPIFFP